MIADAIVAYDEAGTIQSFNPAAARLFGYSPSELTGRPLTTIIPEALRVGACSTFGTHKSGASFPLRVTVHEVSSNGSRQFVLVARETALRARGYEDLLNEHSLLLATLEATADGILVVDRVGKIVRFNERFARLWRLPEEVLNMRDDDRALEFVLEQLSDPQAFIDKVQELYAHPDAESFDVIEFKDGRVYERLSVPQRVDGKAVGRVWSFRDVTDLAVEERRARRRLDRLDALWRVVSRSDLDRADLATRVLEEGARALGLPIGVIVRQEGDRIVVDYTNNDERAVIWRGKELPPNESFGAFVIQAGKTIDYDDLIADEHTRNHPRVVESELRAMIATPLSVAGKTYALMFCSQRSSNEPFDDEDRTYIELLADYIGRILLMQEQDQRISYLAFHDPLTALANRTQFHNRLGETIAAARRHQRRFGLVYIDLDRFKEVNDTLGHAGGDHILVEAARRLGGAVRQEDVVARLGGDEFAV
ncbi:MAG TPA: diguanylate cyclase, partial [Candidatus Eremiobacteraceae bacterium]|nr:diguanylate cyclase [Candidatus Eremiobacteraceae bacterium]